MARDVVLTLTYTEAAALFGMAKAGEDEWADTISHARDMTQQRRTALLAAGGRALQKLRDA